MTNFNRAEFDYHGGYLTYGSGASRKFVGRFKYGDGHGPFRTFLIKNFTVEEYFHELEVNKEAPLTILEKKGYVSPIVKKALKKQGFAPTSEGYQAWRESRLAHHAKLHKVA